MSLLRWATARREMGMRDVGILYHESGHCVIKLRGSESWTREAITEFVRWNLARGREAEISSHSVYNEAKKLLTVVVDVQVPHYINN